MRGPEEEPQPHELAEAPPGAGIFSAGDHLDRVRVGDNQPSEHEAGGEDAPEAYDRGATTARRKRRSERRDEDRRGQRDRPGRVPEPRPRDAQSRDGEGAEAEGVGTPRPPPVETGQGEDGTQKRRGQHTERAQRPPVVDRREQHHGRRRDSDPGSRAEA